MFWPLPPLKIFLNPYPPPKIFGQAHVLEARLKWKVFKLFWKSGLIIIFHLVIKLFNVFFILGFHVRWYLSVSLTPKMRRRINLVRLLAIASGTRLASLTTATSFAGKICCRENGNICWLMSRVQKKKSLTPVCRKNIGYSIKGKGSLLRISQRRNSKRTSKKL